MSLLLSQVPLVMDEDIGEGGQQKETSINVGERGRMGKERKKGRQEKRSKRKSKWSSDSSTDSESKSTSTSSGSDDGKAGFHHVSARTNGISKPAGNESPHNIDVEKNVPSQLSGKDINAGLQRNKLKVTEENSHEEGKLSPKSDELPNNGHGNKAAKQRNYVDGSDRSSVSPTPKRMPNNSRRSSQSMSPINDDLRSPPRKSGKQKQGRTSCSPLSSPARKAPAHNQGRISSRSPSPGSMSKRIRKGRGLTDRFSFARRYRTPSPDHSPPRSYHYGGRNIPERNHDRYSSYRNHSDQSTRRRYRSPPRGRSPPRYERRRSRSRSLSRSPVRYRGRYRDRSQSQSPIRSPSPRDKRPAMSEGLKSRLGPRIDYQRSPYKEKSGSRSSRSRSCGSSHSRSPDISQPTRHGNRKSSSPNMPKSSSPSGHTGLVSYAD